MCLCQVYVFVNMCVCLYVWERERDGGRERDTTSYVLFVQPQSMEELTTEAVQDDVEIQNDTQTDAFAVSPLQADSLPVYNLYMSQTVI